MRREFVLVAVIIAACSLSLAAYFLVRKSTSSPEQLSRVKFIMPTGGDFSLPSTAGPFDTKNSRGKVLFIFFGFTNCPHICPLTLSNLNEMVNKLPSAFKDKVQILFISVDPERDTMSALQKRIGVYNNKAIVAATDTDENLRHITQLFGARYSRFLNQAGSPVVDHTDLVFVINEQGQWVDRLEYNAPPTEFRQAFDTANEKRPVTERLHPLKDIRELARNDDCDVGLNTCTLKAGEDSFTLSMSPTPVKQGENIEIQVLTDSKNLKPVLLDFKGVELDMGYLRPELEETSPKKFSAQFNIPACQIQDMHWKARLIVQDSKNELSAVTFNLKTGK